MSIKDKIKNEHGTIVLVFPMPSAEERNCGSGCEKDEGLVEKLVEKLVERAKVNGDDLSKRRIAILRLIMENPKISISKMAEQLQVSNTSIDKHLEYLRKRYIRRVGGDKGGHWEIIENN